MTYSYDPLARLSGSGIDGVLSSSYTYESPGEGKTTPLVSSVTTNGKETEYTYDAFGNQSACGRDERHRQLCLQL